MDDVISLAEFREKRLAEKAQSRDFWAALVGPPVPPAPERWAKVALPHDGSPAELANFNTGLRAGQAGGRYNPKSTGAAYPCGYLQGAFLREFSTDDSAWLVDWERFEHDIRKSGELFDDEREKMPRRRPKLASQRVRDVLIAVDMILLTKHIKGATDIIAEIRNRYGISETTAWRLWDGPDVAFGAWLKPIPRTTPNKSPAT